MFRVYSRHCHPYRGHKRLNSVRPLNSKSQTGIPTTDKVTHDNSSENKSMMVDKVECGRKQNPSVFHKASTTTDADQISKWSRFLSSDATNDGSVMSSQSVSAFVDEDCFPVTYGCSTTNILPSTVSAFSLYHNLQTTINACIEELDFSS